MQKILNFIGGDEREPLSGDWLDNVEPATGRIYSHVPDSDARDVEAAVQAARAAYPGWSAYCGGKSALKMVSEVLALEVEAVESLKGRDIAVVCRNREQFRVP